MTVRAGLLLLLALGVPAAGAQVIDVGRSRAEFDLHTRWGAIVRGRFPAFEGEVTTLADGRRQVRLRLATSSLEINGSPRYTALARGRGLFDAARHPWIEFTSEPYTASVLREGGALDGRLRMHGVEGRERFSLAPSSCARPGHGCEILAEGRVSRDDYGLDGWHWALADSVRFRLHVRFADD